MAPIKNKPEDREGSGGFGLIALGVIVLILGMVTQNVAATGFGAALIVLPAAMIAIARLLSGK